MLEHVTGEHFRSLLEKTCTLYLSDGSPLPIVIDAVEDAPRSRLSENARMPFGVSLSTSQATDFVDGLCAIELPELGRMEGIFVSRSPVLGRDASRAYFYITFN